METLYCSSEKTEIALLTTPAEVGTLVVAFERVAAEQGWQPGTQLHAYLDRAVHIAVVEDGALAGGLQFVLPDASGHLPYRTVWQEADFEYQHIAHVTILALDPQFRGRPALFWPLCVELWRYCVAQGIEAVALECTPEMLHLYQRIGFPLGIVGNLRPHWGDDLCYLCQLGIRDVAGTLLMKAMRSNVYRELVCQAYRADRQIAA